jgi:hypothetical protein
LRFGSMKARGTAQRIVLPERARVTPKPVAAPVRRPALPATAPDAPAAATPGKPGRTGQSRRRRCA